VMDGCSKEVRRANKSTRAGCSLVATHGERDRDEGSALSRGGRCQRITGINHILGVVQERRILQSALLTMRSYSLSSSSSSMIVMIAVYSNQRASQ